MLKLLALLPLACGICSAQVHTHACKAEESCKSASPTTAALASVEQVDSGKFQSESNQHIRADVAVVSTPQQNVIRDPAFWIQVALTLVGVVGIAIALRTLGTVKDQATEIKLQRQAMEDTLRVICRQADLIEKQSVTMEQQRKDTQLAVEKTLVLQFRPKLIVRGCGVGDSHKDVTLWITNVGGSKAQVAFFQLEFHLSGGESSGRNPECALLDQIVFAAGETKVFTFQLPTNIAEMVHRLELYAGCPAEILADGLKRVTCVGVIAYKDDLGIQRMTGMLRVYKAGTNRFTPSNNSDGEYSD